MNPNSSGGSYNKTVHQLTESQKNHFMRYWIITILIIFSLTIISCSSEDDSALKDGKLASDLSEADQFDAPFDLH